MQSARLRCRRLRQAKALWSLSCLKLELTSSRTHEAWWLHTPRSASTVHRPLTLTEQTPVASAEVMGPQSGCNLTFFLGRMAKHNGPNPRRFPKNHYEIPLPRAEKHVFTPIFFFTLAPQPAVSRSTANSSWSTIYSLRSIHCR